MFYLHLLIGLIDSNKYWRVAKYLVAVTKELIQLKLYSYVILTKVQTTNLI